ncbi:MAG: hypothetical protein ACKVU2_09510 [Saprospiraceae bacterium]
MLLVWAHLAWDYSHDGVPAHYFLHRKDMPSISNWWGSLLVPLLTWGLLYRLHHRLEKNQASAQTMGYGFFGALFFGIALSYFFSIGSEAPGVMVMGLFILALFVPIYREEYLLGFVLGMAFTFGGVLPVVVGLVLALMFAFLYILVRGEILFLYSKITASKQ